MFEKTYRSMNTRQHKRLLADYLMKFRPAGANDQEFQVSNLKDISAGGVRFWAEFPILEGTLISVEVLIPAIDRIIRVPARVVRSRRSENAPVYYVAARFMEISDQDSQAIDSFIERIASERSVRNLVPDAPVVTRRAAVTNA